MCGAPRCLAAAAALAAAQRSGLPPTSPGSTPDNPYVIGEEVEGDQPQRVRIVQNIGPLRSQQSAWVAGDGVANAFGEGVIFLLGAQPQRGRLWRVGQSTYHDKTIAGRVAAQTGQTMVEVA